MILLIAGEDIEADDTVIRCLRTGMAYRCGGRAGVMVGTARENIREGFRVVVQGGEVREDDA